MTYTIGIVVVAHPDDEILYAAHLIREFSASGHQCIVVCLTRGERGRTLGLCTQGELADVRTSEFMRAMKVVSATEAEILDLADGSLALQASAMAKVRARLQRHRPHWVATYPCDGVNGHLDHIAAHLAVVDALGSLARTLQPRLLTFHPHSANQGPCVGWKVRGSSEAKAKALAGYRSQALSVLDFLAKYPSTIDSECFLEAQVVSSRNESQNGESAGDR